MLREDLMNGSARWSGGAFQCNITSLSKDSWSRPRLPWMCCFRIEAALSQTASHLILTTISEYKCKNCSIPLTRFLFVKKDFITFVVAILSFFVQTFQVSLSFNSVKHRFFHSRYWSLSKILSILICFELFFVNSSRVWRGNGEFDFAANSNQCQYFNCKGNKKDTSR